MTIITPTTKSFKFSGCEQHPEAVYYDARDLSLHGVFHDGERYRRVPADVAEATSASVSKLAQNTAGGRVRFITDSPYIAIAARMDGTSKWNHFSLSGSTAFDIYADKTRYIATFLTPATNYEEGYEAYINTPLTDEHEYTVNMPLYANVKELLIGIAPDSVMKPAEPYGISTPIVFYGSSITQGACASRPGCCYENIISRKLDADIIDLGFSGNAKAELAIANYVASLDMSAFVYDYDHNAPNPAHLLETHERMFKIVREAHPDIPIIMMTRPRYYLTEEEEQRVKIVRKTYETALEGNDKNVAFIKGADLIDEDIREIHLVDGCHPNDAGFASMARVVANKLREMMKLR